MQNFENENEDEDDAASLLLDPTAPAGAEAPLV